MFFASHGNHFMIVALETDKLLGVVSSKSLPAKRQLFLKQPFL